MTGAAAVNLDLGGDDFFTCESFNCRMLKRRCVDRRQIALERDNGPGTQLYQCKACEQGQENKRQLAEKESSREETIKMVVSSESEAAPLCKRCGENPAVMRKDTGKLVNGLCGPCRVKRSKEKRLEREKKKENFDKKTDLVKIRNTDGGKNQHGQRDDPDFMPVSLVAVNKLIEREYPDMMEKLKRAASQNFRTALYQIVAYISDGLKRDGIL